MTFTRTIASKIHHSFVNPVTTSIHAATLIWLHLIHHHDTRNNLQLNNIPTSSSSITIAFNREYSPSSSSSRHSSNDNSQQQHFIVSRILTNKTLAANDNKSLRMQTDATLPLTQRRNYTNAIQALYRIQVMSVIFCYVLLLKFN